MLRRFLLAVLALIFINFAAGCYDYSQIDEQAYVVALGIDIGVLDKWRITFQVADVRKQNGSSGGGDGSGGLGEAGGGGKTLTFEAPSFFAGMELANSLGPRELTLLHTKFIVFSEELARSDMTGEFFTPLLRFREMRRTAHIIVSKGSAMEFIESLEPFIGNNVSKTQELIMQQTKNSLFFPHTTLNDLNNAIKSTYDQALVAYGAVTKHDSLEEKKDVNYRARGEGGFKAGELPRKGGIKIEIFGSAVGDGDRMVGVLNGMETRMVLMTRGELKEDVIFTVPDPQEPNIIIPIGVTQSKSPEVKIDISKSEPHIELKIFLKGEIKAIQSGINYEDEKIQEAFEEAVKNMIKQQLDDTIKKCQEFSSDVFGFGKIARVRKFLTIREWEEYNWNNRFKDAVVTTTVDFYVSNTGRLLKTSPIIKVREGE